MNIPQFLHKRTQKPDLSIIVQIEKDFKRLRTRARKKNDFLCKFNGLTKAEKRAILCIWKKNS